MTGRIPKHTGWQRIVRATLYSLQGLKAAWQNEAAFRQELLLVVLLTPLALQIGHNATQKILLLASLFIVLITELLNSAIEATVDRGGTEFHPLAGQAKDIGSAAVFISLLLVVVTWSLVIWENWQ
ncbi:diacylglycerol kinase [Candidatus Magnetaquicoccus inordinatus]|uniref:diacylglycerol kinase n=1 Tax=Candidatus Magnetaquicoccus inordinatus TaxID=2496818 RepID=UPI00102BBC78|nr:diacylglycerol kinase [Candidatus Magnetaquicoccus inordinatus]